MMRDIYDRRCQISPEKVVAKDRETAVRRVNCRAGPGDTMTRHLEKGRTRKMTTTKSAKDIATSYAQAWLDGNPEKALTFVADDVVCEAPSGPLTGLAAVREFLTPFSTSISNAHLVDVLGDDEHVAVVYRVDTPVAKDYVGAEYLTVTNGKIVQSISIFDTSPFIQAAAAQQG